MRVFNDLNQLPPFHNAVVTIGSFDGVHLGHLKIIEKVKQLAWQCGGESVLITFHPHPRQIIYPQDDTLQLLTTIEEKTYLLEKLGIDNLVIVPFTVEFSQQSADEYIQKFLVGRFHPKYIVIGYDHRFGLGRQGDIHYLKWHAPKEGYEVVEIEKQVVDDIAVSSSKIRTALERADIRSANQLLDHFYSLTGTVVRGQNLGSKLGFPTANIQIAQKHKLIPPDGVYAVHVIYQQRQYGGMLYIGHRPTVHKSNNRSIEVNIFDFNQDIYGDVLRIELVDFIRHDAKFDNLEQLRKQLGSDQIKTEAILKGEALSEREKKIKNVPPVVIVILNYNGLPYLQRFLPSLLDTTYPRFSIVVADNGSSDGSLDFLKAHYPEIRQIDLRTNHGFAQGYNLALQQVEARYYVLLNSDVEVTPQWIDPIIELMEQDPAIAACQPKIKAYNQKDYFEYAGASGGWLDAWGYPFCRGRIFAVTEKDTGQYDEPAAIFWATGAAFFIRAELFHQAGGFDPDYFAHAEEIDLCWRLKRAGYKIMVQPQSVVYHLGGGTLNYNTPGKTYLNFRNSLYNLLKNEPLSKLAWLLPLRVLLDGLAGLLFLSQGKFSHIASIIKAHWAFFPKIPAIWKKRKEYDLRIRKMAISSRPDEKGRYAGSIVWQYYARGKHYFKQL